MGCSALPAGVAQTQGSITVSPGIPIYAKARAKQLGLANPSDLLSILLHNYLHGPPLALPVVERPARVVKVRMQLSISRALRTAGTKAARRWDLSLSELVESLVIADADADRDGLHLSPLHGAPKPTLKL